MLSRLPANVFFLSIFLVKMISEVEQIRKQRPDTKLPQPIGTAKNEVYNNHTSFQSFLDI